MFCFKVFISLYYKCLLLFTDIVYGCGCLYTYWRSWQLLFSIQNFNILVSANYFTISCHFFPPRRFSLIFNNTQSWLQNDSTRFLNVYLPINFNNEQLSFRKISLNNSMFLLISLNNLVTCFSCCLFFVWLVCDMVFPHLLGFHYLYYYQSSSQ